MDSAAGTAAREATPASVSVVVPVYRSEASLRALVARLQAVLDAHPAPAEIILVNDDSPDSCWGLIAELAAADPRVRGIDLMRNFGQHNALLCGIRSARHDAIVTLDADLQHPPEAIPSLLAKLGEGWDVVYGVPEAGRPDRRRALASRLVRAALGTLHVATADIGHSFRAFRTPLRDAFALYQGPFVSLDVLLTWGTRRFAALPVPYRARVGGRSSYSLWRLLAHGFDVVTGFSAAPLQLASWIGFFFTLFGIGVLAYVLGRYFMLGYSMPGFPFLASIIAIFSGAQLFALGIIGEYLARMHFRLMDRPTYVVRQILEPRERPDDGPPR